MNYFRRKLYALLRSPQPHTAHHLDRNALAKLACLQLHLDDLEAWWLKTNDRAATASSALQRVAASSDRVNLHPTSATPSQACHPISGQKHSIRPSSAPDPAIIPDAILAEHCPQKSSGGSGASIQNFLPDRIQKPYCFLLTQFYPTALCTATRQPFPPWWVPPVFQRLR